MDPEALRDDVPALESAAYMNTGASGPSPRRVVDAAVEFQRRHEFEAPAEGDVYPLAFSTYEAVRERVAEFVGATPSEVALTQSTADGIASVASAIDWDPGDVVVTTDLEHPAGRLPWERLADRRGIEVRVLETDAGRFPMADLKAAVADARLVSLSSITWTHGTRWPVSEVVEVAHDAGAEVLVDAVQSVGQVPVDVESWGADYVAAAGHKWLLGVWGGGFLYVDSAAVEGLEPDRVGYRSVENPKEPGYALKPGAARLEVGTTSLPPHVALVEAVETIEAVGLGTVQSRIERLTGRLKKGLGDRLVSPREYESGLVTFDAEDPEATAERLQAEGVVVRHLPHPDAVRASVHAFNTVADVERLLDAL